MISLLIMTNYFVFWSFTESFYRIAFLFTMYSKVFFSNEIKVMPIITASEAFVLFKAIIESFLFIEIKVQYLIV